MTALTWIAVVAVWVVVAIAVALVICRGIDTGDKRSFHPPEEQALPVRLPDGDAA